jgi:hypothetical protein
VCARAELVGVLAMSRIAGTEGPVAEVLMGAEKAGAVVRAHATVVRQAAALANRREPRLGRIFMTGHILSS